MKEKRITRLIKLLQTLQNGQGQNSAGLARACGVGRRTIFRDLETLREAGVPLEFDAKAGRFSIAAGSFLPPTDLTAEETLSIMTLAGTFKRQRRRLPFYLAMQSAAAKLERNLPPIMRQKVRRLARAIEVRGNRIVNLAEKEAIYQQLVEAIDKRCVVEIEYQSLTEWDAITTKLQPYQLLFSQHSWYAIGRSSLHREVRIFNLSRIVSAKAVGGRFAVPRSFSLDRFLGNAWQLIPDPGRDSHVVVKFGPLVARNVAEVNWHKTQRTKILPDGSMEFHVTVSGITEIAWWILGYGDQAEVLQPAKLRQLIAQRARNMAAKYAKDS